MSCYLRAGDRVKTFQDTRGANVPIGIFGKVLATSDTLSVYIEPECRRYLDEKSGKFVKLPRTIKVSFLDLEFLPNN